MPASGRRVRHKGARVRIWVMLKKKGSKREVNGVGCFTFNWESKWWLEVTDLIIGRTEKRKGGHR